MSHGVCIPPEPIEDVVGDLRISTIQACDGCWETCVIRGNEVLEEETEITWDGPEEQHRAVVERMRRR